MSERQIALLNEANRSLAEEPPDLELARTLLEKALGQGERFDILLLSLGRTMQLLDECRDARQLFDEMSTAPHEPSVPRAALEDLRQDYASQMSTHCSAWLTVTCETNETILNVEGDPLRCGQPIKLSAGTYTVSASLGSVRENYEVEVQGGEERTLHVEMSEKQPAEPKAKVSDSTRPRDPTERKPKGELPEPAQGPLSGREDPPWSEKYSKTLASGVTTVALTSASAIVWAVSRGQADEQLRGFASRDDTGMFRWDGPPPENAVELQAQARPWVVTEALSGWAVPVFLVAGSVTTALFWTMEGSDTPQVTLLPVVDPTRGDVAGALHIRW
jgi:hypothetical protein